MFNAHRLIPLLFLYSATTIADTPVLAHDLFISFDRNGTFSARDIVTMEGADLPGLSIDARWTVRSLRFDDRDVEPADHVARGRIDVPDGTATLDIEYAGKLAGERWPYLVWLPGDGWYPDSSRLRHTFRLETALPDAFTALTQGVPLPTQAKDRHAWRQTDPQQGIYLVTGPWHRRDAERDGRRAVTLLLDDDPQLAERYLDAALHWMRRFEDALGTYPYHAFALVENRRQTGWGMPGFTLLGSHVIRLPFIVHTSYPHEIAHNWWGNGVFVDSVRGNWSEPLTTYLSDYLVRESRGVARQYRLDTLTGWHDFVRDGGDFPLNAFTARHDRASQAVGYGKGMFVFHMLRRQLGDDTFLDGLNRFYDRHRFRRAGFDDLRVAFEAVCECELAAFFDQWIERKGAPRIMLADARHTNEAGNAVTLSISQSGAGSPWALRVPVRIDHPDGTATWRDIPLHTRELTVTLPLDRRAVGVSVDPEFDLFRHLGDDERPLTFSRVFGAERVAVVYGDPAYAGVASEVASNRPGWRARAADAPLDEPVVVWLGPATSEALARRGRHADHYEIGDTLVLLDTEHESLDSDKIVALVDEVTYAGRIRPMLWLGATPRNAARAIERLSHYGRYSFAVLRADEPTALRTGQWPVQSQALSKSLGPSAPSVSARRDEPLF